MTHSEHADNCNRQQAGIMNAYMKLMEKESETDDEKTWLAENCPNQDLLDALPGTTTLMLHALDSIGRLEPANGITISKDLKVPRGSISKVCRKLVDKQLISTDRPADNKKEILYMTTELGQELYVLHKKLHEEMEKNFRNFLNKYSKEDLMIIEPFLNELAAASFVRIKEHTPE